MAKKKAKKKAANKVKPVKKSPRQEQLPGMEDRAIKAIDNAAGDYADVRDERQKLTAQEASLKTELLNLMHKFKKTHYKHGTVEITVKPEGEKITVRIKDENEEKPDDTQPEETEEVEESDSEIPDAGAVPDQMEESEAQPD